MDKHVSVKVGSSRTFVVALIAAKVLFGAVYEHVPFQIKRVCTSEVTLTANEGLLTTMGKHVLLEVP